MDCVQNVLTHAVVRTWHESPQADIEVDVARLIASQFQISEVTHVQRFAERGNINLHTFAVTTTDGEYLLQRLNNTVFAYPERVMQAMQAWTETQRQALADYPVQTWHPITLVPTKDGLPCLDLSIGGVRGVWRLMVRIPDSVSFKSLSELPTREQQLALAHQVGRGLAISADLTCTIEASNLKSSLPGYRDTHGYYAQFESILGGHRELDAVNDNLPADPDVRKGTEALYILDSHLGDAEAQNRRLDPELRPYLELLEQEKSQALTIADGVREGWLRATAIHGDTKIENFLFDRTTLEVKSLVDLDTIIPYTWLADWGDCLRSLCNVAGEKTTDLNSVQVDQDVYEAVATGFFSVSRNARPEEIALMADAVEIITLELGLRFLTDYLRGDNYFGLGENDPADLNKTRAIVQLTLYQRLRDARPWTEALLERLSQPLMAE